MGQCIRSKMVEVGLFPPAPAPAVADATEPVQIADLAPSDEAVPDEPALDVTPPTGNAEVVDAEAADDMIAATFGLLRAEPDGSVVIAGSGKPGSQVEIFANDASIGSTDVEASGDWAFVPDAPLPPGNLEITLGEVGKPGRAPQSFVVVINEDKTTQPLVVASVPGQASEVLQGLTPQVAAVDTPTQTEQTAVEIAEADAVADTPEIAAAPGEAPAPSEPAAEPAPATATANVAEVAPETTPEPETEIASAEQAATPDAVEIAAVPESNASAPAVVSENETVADNVEAAPVDMADAPEATVPVEVTAVPGDNASAPQSAAGDETNNVDATSVDIADAPEVTEPVEVAAALGALETPTDLADTEPQSPASERDVEVAAVEQVEAVEPSQPANQIAPAPAPASASALASPTIDAIEIDGNRTFFAGAGPNGAIVRLYVDDAYIGDADVADGRWLVEAGSVLTKPNQRVRADLLAAGSSTVVARSEVDFVIDLPGADVSIDVAEDTTPAELIAPQVAEAAPSVPQAEAPSQPAVAFEQSTAAPVEAPAVQQAETLAAEPEAVVADSPETVVADTLAQPARVAPEPTVPAPTVVPTETAAPSEQATPAASTEPSASDVAAVEAPAQPQATNQAAVADAAPAEPVVPTMVAVSLGDPDAQRFASGKAIIRRGDNLWTIARRVYGEGLKFTTIYEANTGQIRNPDRIYPGQVFDLPSGASQ